MSQAEKMVTPSGRLIIRCPQCKHWRDGKSFLVGAKNPKDRACWVPRCEYCRKPDALLEKVGYPGGDVKVTDKAEDCHCGDGSFRFSNGAVSICFRCQGKGWCSWADLARNYYYDLKQAERACRADEVAPKEESTKQPEPKPEVESVEIEDHTSDEEVEEEFEFEF